ncbi:MAG: phosphoribosyltransferase [Saprospiraceae bacterium]|nr:phosphoribosyltransferase [Saprospiraceae bacterium]
MIILEKQQIQQKIKRMAMEIYERHSNDKEIVMIGIHAKGALLADEICKELKKLSPLICTQASLHLNKLKPTTEPITLSVNISVLKNKPLIVVDDVANSGKTMFYALGSLLGSTPHSIETAVLVERLHKRFPVEISFVGIKLATTIKEHIEVSLQAEEDWMVELS